MKALLIAAVIVLMPLNLAAAQTKQGSSGPASKKIRCQDKPLQSFQTSNYERYGRRLFGIRAAFLPASARITGIPSSLRDEVLPAQTGGVLMDVSIGAEVWLSCHIDVAYDFSGGSSWNGTRTTWSEHQDCPYCDSYSGYVYRGTNSTVSMEYSLSGDPWEDSLLIRGGVRFHHKELSSGSDSYSLYSVAEENKMPIHNVAPVAAIGWRFDVGSVEYELAVSSRQPRVIEHVFKLMVHFPLPWQ